MVVSFDIPKGFSLARAHSCGRLMLILPDKHGCLALPVRNKKEVEFQGLGEEGELQRWMSKALGVGWVKV
jgi:hypothetical protein